MRAIYASRHHHVFLPLQLAYFFIFKSHNLLFLLVMLDLNVKWLCLPIKFQFNGLSTTFLLVLGIMAYDRK